MQFCQILAQLLLLIEYNSSFLISMKAIIEQLKSRETVTVSQLEKDIRQRSKHNNNNTSIFRSSQEPADIKITSPFYQRYNHKHGCRCIYHQRIKPQPIKIIKKTTEQQKADGPLIISLNNQMNPVNFQQGQFQLWKGKMTEQNLKKYYSQFLKTLPNLPKSKKRDKLDNYNQAFQQFLKARFQLQQAKIRREQELRLIKQSCRTIKRFLTDGNIITQEDQQRNSNYSTDHRLSSAHKQNSKSGFSRKDSSTFSNFKHKSIVQCTGLTLDFINQQSTKQKRDKQKKGKFNRSSFFQLVEDQELLKQLCIKFMSQNKKNNREGQMLLKQLVQADLDQFSKITKEMSQKIEGGLRLQHLDDKQTNTLVKIILNKIQSRTKLVKKCNSDYASKTIIIDSLRGKLNKEKSMNLRQFWKMIKQKELSNSRFGTHQKIFERRASKQKMFKSMEFRPSSKQLNSGTKKTMSKGSFFQDSYQTITTYDNQIFQSSIKEQAEQQFKFNAFLPIPKKGLLKKKTVRLLSEQMDDKRKTVIFKENTYYNVNTEIIDKTTDQVEHSEHASQNEDERRNSEIRNIKNKVHRHVELNKKFLQRIESDLVQIECEALIIDFGESIITKKRKIRAITRAIESIDVQSKKYLQIQKYLKIFTEYCGLVVNAKKQPPAIYHQRINKEEKQSEGQQLDSLLGDLKKQRGLKFVNLSLLEKNENPRQELIIKIPQSSSKKKQRQAIMPIIKTQLIAQAEGQHLQQIRQQSGLVQSQLSQISHVKCYNNYYQAQKQNIFGDLTNEQIANWC